MNEQQPNPFSGLDMFTRMWSDFGEKMMRNGMAFPQTQNAPEAARECATRCSRLGATTATSSCDRRSSWK